MTNKLIAYTAFGLAILAIFGVSQMYTVSITPTLSQAQTPSKYQFTDCSIAIDGACQRLDRVIAQNEQIIKLDAYNFCVNYYAMGQVVARGYGGFDNCVQKVQEETK